MWRWTVTECIEKEWLGTTTWLRSCIPLHPLVSVVCLAVEALSQATQSSTPLLSGTHQKLSKFILLVFSFFVIEDLISIHIHTKMNNMSQDDQVIFTVLSKIKIIFTVVFFIFFVKTVIFFLLLYNIHVSITFLNIDLIICRSFNLFPLFNLNP